MNSLKKSLVLLILPLVAFSAAHKFYVSVSNVVYSEKDMALQITSRVFIDDFEKVLKERYGLDAQLATQSESKLADEYIEKYFRAKFIFWIDNEVRPYQFLGRKYDNDVIICYLEILDIDLGKTKSIAVQNELLTDLYDEQQNVVHFKIKDKKKSFVLIRENNKGMLNL